MKKSFPRLAASTAALRRGTADLLNISHVFRPASGSSACEKASAKLVPLPKVPSKCFSSSATRLCVFLLFCSERIEWQNSLRKRTYGLRTTVKDSGTKDAGGWCHPAHDPTRFQSGRPSRGTPSGSGPKDASMLRLWLAKAHRPTAMPYSARAMFSTAVPPVFAMCRNTGCALRGFPLRSGSSPSEKRTIPADWMSAADMCSMGAGRLPFPFFFLFISPSCWSAAGAAGAPPSSGPPTRTSFDTPSHLPFAGARWKSTNATSIAAVATTTSSLAPNAPSFDEPAAARSAFAARPRASSSRRRGCGCCCCAIRPLARLASRLPAPLFYER